MAKQKRIDPTELGLDPEKLPQHVAIIMDGNGRWAREKGKPRIFGHRAGIESVRDVVRACSQIGIGYLTLYTFSRENWRRPRSEVTALMRMLRDLLRKEIEELDENDVRVRGIGRIDDLPDSVRSELRKARERTEANKGLVLILALSYGGRDEIADAAARAATEVAEGNILPADITEEAFSGFLYAPDIPDPDLLIRTSGELRVSNFLLWQIAYSEIWVTDVLWPDFSRKELFDALASYQKRERRFGGVE
jgi:undecaprenyl diphosphate synthase